MFRQLFVAWCLMAASVVIHAYGVVAALQWLRRRKAPDDARLAPWAWLFVAIAGWIILLHVVEIVVWAVVYAAIGAMPDLQAGCTSARSPTRPRATATWCCRRPGVWSAPWQALTGILMAGWSTGFFFAVVMRMHDRSVAEPQA